MAKLDAHHEWMRASVNIWRKEVMGGLSWKDGGKSRRNSV
jgi:hypothetical protein